MKHVGLSQSLISHHLSDMKEAKLVKDEKRGLRVYYSLTDKGRYITNLLLNSYKGEKSMEIQVLGSGCPTCKKLYELTKRAVQELGIKEEVEYTTDISKIVEMGVMSSPVLAVDGKPVLTGFVDDVEKIKSLIKKSQEK